MSIKLFGICYVVFGLMAVIGAVLDADGVMAAIRRLPTRWMDRICEKMYKFIMEHRPGLLIKIVYTPQFDTIPGDRVYQIDFCIDAADVEMMSRPLMPFSFLDDGISAPYTSTSELEKYIGGRVRRELYERVMDLVSIRVSHLPTGGVEVNAQLVCRRPKAPQFAWAEKYDMLETKNRFE